MQSVPTYSPTKIVRTVKSITAREVCRRVPSVRQQLWGGAFWSSGYFIDTVGRHGSEETIRRSEETIRRYVQQQGCEDEYKRLYQQPINLALLDAGQMELFQAEAGEDKPTPMLNTPQLATASFINLF